VNGFDDRLQGGPAKLPSAIAEGRGTPADDPATLAADFAWRLGKIQRADVERWNPLESFLMFSGLAGLLVLGAVGLAVVVYSGVLNHPRPPVPQNNRANQEALRRNGLRRNELRDPLPDDVVPLDPNNP
jgi:hypothetical protein